MKPGPAEARGDARIELQRGRQHGPLHGIALLVVILISEKEGPVPMPGVHQLRGLDLAVFYEIAVMVLRIDDDVDLVARLNRGIEIHVPLKNRRYITDQIFTSRLARERRPQRSRYFGVDDVFAALEIDLLDTRFV